MLLPQELGDFHSKRDEKERRSNKEANNWRLEYNRESFVDRAVSSISFVNASKLILLRRGIKMIEESLWTSFELQGGNELSSVFIKHSV